VAAFIFDASAIVKRYLKGTGSRWIHGLADPAAAHEIFIMRIARVEIVAAVARRGRGKVNCMVRSRSKLCDRLRRLNSRRAGQVASTLQAHPA
jgi:hypothetical protein